MIAWEGFLLRNAELNPFPFLNSQTLNSLLSHKACLTTAGMRCGGVGVFFGCFVGLFCFLGFFFGLENRLLACFSLVFHLLKSPTF